MLTIRPISNGVNGSGVVVVSLQGSADIHSESDLEREFTKVAGAKPRLVVIDLHGVDILTSLAIGVLVGFRTRVMAEGGRVAVARVPETIAKTMKFTRVSELFSSYATVEDAVARESAKR